MTDDNPGEQLGACFDVLWAELESRVAMDLGQDGFGLELNTALWQTIELGIRLAEELGEAYDVIDGYRRAVEQAEAGPKIILPGGSSVTTG